jgi:hypothetical protein
MTSGHAERSYCRCDVVVIWKVQRLSGDKNGWATLLLAATPANAVKTLNLCVYRRVRNYRAVKALRSLGKSLSAVSRNRSTTGKHWALHCRSLEMRPIGNRRGHVLHAVMFAGPSAAGGQIGLRIVSEKRHDWKNPQEEQQQGCSHAPHWNHQLVSECSTIRSLEGKSPPRNLSPSAVQSDRDPET